MTEPLSADELDKLPAGSVIEVEGMRFARRRGANVPEEAWSPLGNAPAYSSAKVLGNLDNPMTTLVADPRDRDRVAVLSARIEAALAECDWLENDLSAGPSAYILRDAIRAALSEETT